jgi:hypothetical protein
MREELPHRRPARPLARLLRPCHGPVAENTLGRGGDAARPFPARPGCRDTLACPASSPRRGQAVRRDVGSRELDHDRSDSVRLEAGDHTARQAWRSMSPGPPCRCRSSPTTAPGGRSCSTLPTICLCLHRTSQPVHSSLGRAAHPSLRVVLIAVQGAMPSQANATEPTTVSHAACRSAWARRIVKVYEVDPSCGSCPRSGQREPVALSPVRRDSSRSSPTPLRYARSCATCSRSTGHRRNSIPVSRLAVKIYA